MKSTCETGSGRSRMLTCWMSFKSNIAVMSLRDGGGLLHARANLEIDQITAELGLYDGELGGTLEAPKSQRVLSR